MSFHRIVKNLDAIIYLAPCFITCCIDLFLGHPFFKRCEETLCNGVIMAVASAAHRWFKIVFLQGSQIVSTAILATLITMTSTASLGCRFQTAINSALRTRCRSMDLSIDQPRFGEKTDPIPLQDTRTLHRFGVE